MGLTVSTYGVTRPSSTRPVSAALTITRFSLAANGPRKIPKFWPSIFTAVQEQLGLKLEAVHESVPNLVIDHITKPTEN